MGQCSASHPDVQPTTCNQPLPSECLPSCCLQKDMFNDKSHTQLLRLMRDKEIALIRKVREHRHVELPSYAMQLLGGICWISNAICRAACTRNCMPCGSCVMGSWSGNTITCLCAAIWLLAGCCRVLPLGAQLHTDTNVRAYVVGSTLDLALQLIGITQ